MIHTSETICALSTPPGSGAIGVIRLSGEKAISIANSIFEGKNLEKEKGQTLHFGKIQNKEEVIDEVLVSLFKEPNSYTGEDTIEISCHGSSYILSKVLESTDRAGIPDWFSKWLNNFTDKTSPCAKTRSLILLP